MTRLHRKLLRLALRVTVLGVILLGTDQYLSKRSPAELNLIMSALGAIVVFIGLPAIFLAIRAATPIPRRRSPSKFSTPETPKALT
jgi:hypothetical protein